MTATDLLRQGTYARESGGGCLLYHSPTQWNDASYALHRYLCGESHSSLSQWRRVIGDEADAVWKWCKLGAGEAIEYYPQACRDCGQSFPYTEEADRCPECVAEMHPSQS